MTPRIHPEDQAEIPRMDSADMVLLIQRSIREMQPQPKVVVANGMGWKVATTLLGILAAILTAIGGWGLVQIVAQGRQIDTVVSDVAVIKCQLADSCKHAVTRGVDD